MLVEGFKRETHPKLEVFRAAVGKPLLHPDDPNIVAIASDGAVAARVPVVSLDDIEAVADILVAKAAPLDARRARAERLMAQLTDDCFAFGGPLLAIDEVERLIGERVTPVAETETVALQGRARARARRRRGRADRPAAVRQFGGRWLRGAPRRSRAKDETRLAIVDRLTAGRAAARAVGAGEAIRIFTGAPMPQGADTVFMQEDVRARGRGRGRAAGPEARRQPPARRRGCGARLGRAARPAAGCSRRI